jgi:TonB family protein
MKSSLAAQVMAAAAVGLLVGSTTTAQHAGAQDQWPPPGVHIPGQEGVTPPRLIWDVKANYTAAAMRARVEGIVLLHCVVKTDGTVGAVRVFKSLDAVYGLDASAVDALKQWRFAPGEKAGAAVPVLVFIEMKFALADSRSPLQWPPAFVVLASPAGWTERETETSDLRIRISHPERWHVHAEERSNNLIFAHDATGARALAISRPQETTLRLDRRFSAAQLQRAVDTLKPMASGRGTEVPGTGQAEFAGRLWFWVEEYYPTFDAGRASLPPDVAEQFDWESGRQWLFTTTFGGHMIRVSARLSYPRGMSASDKEEQTRQAGAEFAAMLQRFSVTMR